MQHDPFENDQRLSQIQTNWTEVFGGVFGNQSDAPQACDAQRDLLIRYVGPVYRYLRAAVRDSDVADDLAQEFAFRILRGDFKKADPQRGRFRDFIKRALRNLVNDHFRRQNKSPISLTDDVAQVSGSNPGQTDEAFDQGWRREILALTWTAMDEADVETKTCYAVVLKARAQDPSADSTQLALQVGEKLQREVNAAWVRQNLRRARVRFNELLRKEVCRTIGSNDAAAIESELAELGLLKYTRT